MPAAFGVIVRDLRVICNDSTDVPYQNRPFLAKLDVSPIRVKARGMLLCSRLKPTQQ